MVLGIRTSTNELKGKTIHPVTDVQRTSGCQKRKAVETSFRVPETEVCDIVRGQHGRGSLLLPCKETQSPVWETFGCQLGGIYNLSTMSWTEQTMVSVMSPKWNYAKKPNISSMSEVCYSYSDGKRKVVLRNLLFKGKSFQSLHKPHQQTKIWGSDTVKNTPSGFTSVISMWHDNREATYWCLSMISSTTFLLSNP